MSSINRLLKHLSCYNSLLVSISVASTQKMKTFIDKNLDFVRTVRFSSPLSGPLLRVLLFALLSSFFILPAHRRNLPLTWALVPKRKTFKPTWSSKLFAMKRSTNQFHAFCKLYHIDIDVSSREKGDLERHAATERHKDNASSAGHSSLISFFIRTQQQRMIKQPLLS